MTDASKRKRRPTQADVARLAGVSQAAVSQVLSESASIAVSPETRQRILDAASALGYVPDHTARSLRTRKTYAIAGIVPDITNPFYPAFGRGIQDVAEKHGYDLIIYNTDGHPEKEAKCLHSIRQGRADGMIAVLFHVTAKDLRVLLEGNIFVVRLEAAAKKTGDLPLDNLYVDNVAAARTATAYLIGRGHRRIAMIAGRKGPGEWRVLGYRQALTEAYGSASESYLEDRDFTVEGGYEGTRALLAMSPRPTAVFAANDLIAIGALKALREAGLRVPDDVAVVGFDDIPAAVLVSPALTTITQFPAKLGQRAAKMLFERLHGSAPEGGRCEKMPYKLIVRESA